MSVPLWRMAHRLIRKPSKPRQFPTAGFEVIESSRLVEEEEWEWYQPKEFYPVSVGEVFKSRYQIVGKLGYGTNSTAWLCRDLWHHKHITLKIGTPDALEGELRVLRHLRTTKATHPGSSLVRQMLDEFELSSKDGPFQCIVYPPLAIPVKAFRSMLPDRALPPNLLKLVLKHLLLSLDFLHSEAKVIHTGKSRRIDHHGLIVKALDCGSYLNQPTDIQENNLLLGMNEVTAKQDLENFEKEELISPGPRKIDGERVIYKSRALVPRVYSYGRPVLCDFSEARFGEYDKLADIQPYQYRAPEVIFDIPWDEKVDIWNVGVMIWDLLGNGNLFRTTGGPEDRQDNIHHLAQMVALLGPAPKEFLAQTKGSRVQSWFDENGNWKGATEVPKGTLEDAEKQFEGEEKALFLGFMKKMLRWKPEERSSAKELLGDVWLNKG